MGDPGFLISDASLARKHWQEKGNAVINQYFLTGKDHWQGFHPLDEAVSDLSQL